VEGTGGGGSIGVDVAGKITPFLRFDTQASQAAFEGNV
jgi:hypothetical protein